MGLYIEGIELPKKGRYTTFTVYGDGTVVYRFGGNLAGKATPAADVVEVRHGRWYLNNGCALCSECKNSFTPSIRSQALFCPRCGAKMDGGQDK